MGDFNVTDVIAAKRGRIRSDDRIELPQGLGVPDAVARLIAALPEQTGEDYLVYERHGCWTLAVGVRDSIELDRDEVRVGGAAGVVTKRWTGRPAEVLARELDELMIDGEPAFGWIAFEFGALRHGVLDKIPAGTALARVFTARCRISVSSSGVRVESGEASASLLAEALRVHKSTRNPVAVNVANDTCGYRDRVARAISEIVDGKYQKVILSRSVDVPFDVDFPATYCLGRRHNTPARSFLLRHGGIRALGFSPELVVEVRGNGAVVTEPLAGTRAFGRGAVADRQARDDLESDAKEIVEHALSVRVSLREISEVTVSGSAAVTEFMSVRERGSVQHLASTVQGRLAGDRNRMDALEALFPAVTASGIPKTPGVEAILRLDETPRGLYSGAVVMFTSDGGLDAALALRTLYQDDSRTWLRAGAGIIAGSTPDREFDETCEKMGCLAPHLVPRS